MNILRWKRKSNKKIRPKTLLLFIFSLIMTTFAWFAYSKVLEPTLNIHLASWDMSYEINGNPTENPISIEIPILSPTMDEEIVIVDIFNNGETKVDIDYQVKSLTVAGITYQAILEGMTPPASGNYITIAPSILETEEITDETTGEVLSTNQIFKGAVTNDITRFPFTIEIEHSAQVDAVTHDLYGGADTPGEGYLKVTVNWVGDNDRLDSEWGYAVGDYLSDKEETTPAMTIELSIDSYQVDPAGGTIETTMPSTSSTRPYLPEGYKRVVGTSLTTGLVIEDDKGNQYVWVEVPRSTSVYTTAGINITNFTSDEYNKIETDLRNYVSAYSTREDTFKDYDASGLSTETYPILKNNMLKSIYSHGGFYIGRYETGVEGDARTKATSTTPTELPVIKANVYPYNWVTCAQANTIASRLKQTGYTTSLMFGLQWDLVLKYIETKGVSQEGWVTVDSTPWGNYLNNSYTLTNSTARHNQSSTGWLTTIPYEKNENAEVLVSSGANSTFCMQNIYDLAGNLSEWTYNIIYDNSISNYVGGNGGDYLTNGADTPANYYGSYNTRTGAKHIGFRISLISEADAVAAWGDDGSGSGAEPDDPVDTGNLPSTDYTKPYMPSDDFEYVEGDLDSGIVIADAKGNEYVWVEVPRNATVYNDSSDSAEDDLNDDGTIDDTTNDDILSYNPDSLTVAQYNAIETELKEYTKTYRKKTAYVDEFYSTDQHGFEDADDYNDQKYKMLKSVFKYGGFYVGRYETGIANAPKTSGSISVEIPSETPVIKKDAYPYNYVTNKQAQKLASTKFDGGDRETSLLFGVQWDLILKYMETKAVQKGETDETTIINALNADSTSWGNYKDNNWTIENTDSKYYYSSRWTSGLYNGTGNKGNTSTSILLSTGADESFSKQNIYDIAGNVYEWTLEYTSYTSLPCAIRGGRYYSSGLSYPASGRSLDSTTYYGSYDGFRVSLY